MVPAVPHAALDREAETWIPLAKPKDRVGDYMIMGIDIHARLLQVETD
jgi:hypothetical protein